LMGDLRSLTFSVNIERYVVIFLVVFGV
jgi:hypothetical protein